MNNYVKILNAIKPRCLSQILSIFEACELPCSHPLKINMASNRYCIEVAKRGTAGCKECKKKIDKGLVRIAKIIPNPFTESGGEMKQWFHSLCIFNKLSRARASTKKIDNPDDLEGWDELPDEFKPDVLKQISDFSNSMGPMKFPQKKTPPKKKSEGTEDNKPIKSSVSDNKDYSSHRDNSLREFRKVCAEVESESKYLGKTAIFRKFFKDGSDGDGFKGDLNLWVKLLLPGVEKRIYNLQSKQLVKLFSEIFEMNHEEMLEDLDQGDVAQTVATFFQNSENCPPATKSTLTLQEVDSFLDELSKLSKEAEQSVLLKKVAKKCTANDLQMFIRFINHDLRIKAGPKPVLDAIHESAYEAFQASRNLKDIVTNVLESKSAGGKLTVQSSLMTPVIPMLAMACGSVKEAFKRFPDGFFVEIKYDGERVQLHKRGDEFSFFSRSLKPVMPHKVMHLKDYIPKAFPHGNNLILDAEILLVTNDGQPLPFGTLGAHKKTAFKDASVCLFVFDCLQFNDEILLKKPLIERRAVLHKNMTEIKNHIMFSEMKEINDPKELRDIINSVLKQGLEGIVIKNKMSDYEPGKRHWLKVKKDYLKAEDLKKGVMPDSADLLVLGAYYGTGKFGGKKSVFLMGCYDENCGKWCTVTKVKGFKDDVLETLQSKPEMIEINKNIDLVPSWLKIKKPLVPDFLIKDVEKSAVWEIIGAEFSKAEIHTASGISIRFPRVKCFRDKTWKQTTSLKQLQDFYNISMQTADTVGLEVIEDEEEMDADDTNLHDVSMEVEETAKKRKKKKSEDEPDTPRKKVFVEAEETPKKKEKKNIDEDPDARTKKAELDGKKKEASSSLQTKNKILPNIFSGVKLYIPPSVQDADVLHRYFIAYDGTVLKDHEKDEANIVISPWPKDEPLPKGTEVISVDWLWTCIKLKKRFSTKLYRV